MPKHYDALYPASPAELRERAEISALVKSTSEHAAAARNAQPPLTVEQIVMNTLSDLPNRVATIALEKQEGTQE